MVLPFVLDTSAIRFPTSNLRNALAELQHHSALDGRSGTSTRDPKAAPASRPATVAAVRQAVEIDLTPVGWEGVAGHPDLRDDRSPIRRGPPVWGVRASRVESAYFVVTRRRKTCLLAPPQHGGA